MGVLKCILLVDDDNIANYLHKRLINRTGIKYIVHIAKNGKEALAFLRQKDINSIESYCYPQLILLDLNMPVMDGFEFMEEYCELQREIRDLIQIVVLTSSENNHDLEKIMKLGIQEVLNKPFTQQKFEMLIDKYFMGS